MISVLFSCIFSPASRELGFFTYHTPVERTQIELEGVYAKLGAAVLVGINGEMHIYKRTLSSRSSRAGAYPVTASCAFQ